MCVLGGPKWVTGCMPNIAAIISSHNTKVLKPDPDPNTRTCSCRNKQQCPLGGNFLAECIVYQTTVTAATKPTRHYFGLTEGNFKTRYNTHMHSFRAEQCRKATELSKYVWDLKSENLEYDIKRKLNWSKKRQPTDAAPDAAKSAWVRKWW